MKSEDGLCKQVGNSHCGGKKKHKELLITSKVQKSHRHYPEPQCKPLRMNDAVQTANICWTKRQRNTQSKTDFKLSHITANLKILREKLEV